VSERYTAQDDMNYLAFKQVQLHTVETTIMRLHGLRANLRTSCCLQRM